MSTLCTARKVGAHLAVSMFISQEAVLLTYDPGLLALGLLRASVGADDKARWHQRVAGFDDFAAYSAELGAAQPSGTTIMVSNNAAELDAELLRLDIEARFAAAQPGVGIITSREQRIALPPAGAFLVRRPYLGGYNRFIAVGGDQVQVYDFERPLKFSPELRVALPKPTERESVACVPIRGGTLWLVGTPKGDDLELFAVAQHTIARVESVARSDRWSHVLFPEIQIQQGLEIDWAEGATLGDGGTTRLAGAYQHLSIKYEARRLPVMAPPRYDPFEDLAVPLAFNGPTLVFKTGTDGLIQWLYWAEPSDWHVVAAQ